MRFIVDLGETRASLALWIFVRVRREEEAEVNQNDLFPLDGYYYCRPFSMDKVFFTRSLWLSENEEEKE